MWAQGVLVLQSLEHGLIATLRNFNRNLAVCTLGGVELPQLSAKPTSIHADNRVHTRIEFSISIIDIHPQKQFIEIVASAFKGLFDHKAQESRHTIRGGEHTARKNFFQLSTYLAWGNVAAIRT